MNLEEYAKKYDGIPRALLRDLAQVRGSHSANSEYKRNASAALQAFGIVRTDADEISETLTAEQIRRLGQHVEEQEELERKQRGGP